MDDRLEEILRRLDALERRVDALSRGDHDESHETTSCPFREEERRIVDLIVGLVGERVEQIIDERHAHMHGPEGHPHPPPGPPPPYFDHGERRGPPRRR